MTNDSIANDILTAARDAVLDVLPKAWAVYVYGSFALGDARLDSDLDIAVLLPPGETLAQSWELSTKLANRIGRDVDLVDLRMADDILRMQVLKHGHVLYNSRPAAVLEWEGQAMTRYGHYRREVAGLIEQFQESGIGYAESRR